jgi:hypothetical protein
LDEEKFKNILVWLGKMVIAEFVVVAKWHSNTVHLQKRV